MQYHRKVYTELRFPPETHFLDSRGEILRLFWPNRFPQWSLENNLVIKFFDGPSEHKSARILLIEPRRIVFSLEGQIQSAAFLKEIAEITVSLFKIMKVHSLERVGVRSHYCMVDYSFKELLLKKNPSPLFFDPLLCDIFQTKDGTHDYSLVLQTDDHRVEIGPMERRQQHPNLGIFFIKESIPEEFLYVDIDQSIKNTTKKRLEDDLREIVKTLDLHFDALRQYVRTSLEKH